MSVPYAHMNIIWHKGEFKIEALYIYETRDKISLKISLLGYFRYQELILSVFF